MATDTAAIDRKYGRGAGRRRQLRQAIARQAGYGDNFNMSKATPQQRTALGQGSGLGRGLGQRPKGAPRASAPRATKGGTAGGKPIAASSAAPPSPITSNPRNLNATQQRRVAIRKALGIDNVNQATVAQIRRAKRKGGLL